MSWLSKKFEEAAAQLNPFDGGKTASTVRQARQTTPAQTVKKKDYSQKPKQSFFNKVQDQFIGTTEADNYRRWNSPQAQLERSQDAIFSQNLKEIRNKVLSGEVSGQQGRGQALAAAPSATAQYQDVLKPSTAIEQAGQNVIDLASSKQVAPVALGIARSAVGTGEGLSGLYDLATPGVGQNRFGKGLVPMGAELDQTVQDNNYNKWAYKGSQIGTDLATFALGGAPLTKGMATTTKLVSKAPGATRAINYVDDLAKTGNLAQKGLAKSAQYLSRPDVASDLVVDTALSSGLRANRGQDISAGTIAQDVGMGLGFAGGLGVGGAGLKKVTTKLVSNARKSGAIRPSALNPSEVADLSNFRQVAGTGAIYDDATYKRGIAAANKAGIDYRDTGAVDDLLGRHQTYDTRKAQRPQLRPLNQSGSTPVDGPMMPLNKLIPDGKKPKSTDNPLESLKQEARLYHGSRNKIDKFDAPRSYSLESQGTSNAMGRGIYVTENKDFANRFGENLVEMKMPKDTKIFDIADYDRTLTAQEAAAINKALQADAKNWVDKKPLVEPTFKAGDNATESYQELLQEYNQGTSDIMKEAGFQAVKYKEVHTSDMMKRMNGEKVDDNVSYVLFDEKLANDNIATQSQPPKSTPFESDLQKAGLATPGATKPVAQAEPRSGSVQEKAVPQTRAGQREVQQVESLATRQPTQSAVSSDSLAYPNKSKSSPNIDTNNTTSAIDSKEWGSLLLEADKELSFNAVAGSKGTKNSNKLVEAINQDTQLTKAAKEAQQSGKELNFFAKKDANGRSVGIEQFDPNTHRIEAGFVVDKDGNVVGNHIKVDETGIQVNVGGELVNMERVIGNPNQWRGKYRVSETMSRNIDRNAPNKQIAQQTKDFLIGNKVKAEANFRTELQTEYKKLGERVKTVQDARPKGVSKQQYEDDIFSVLNGDKTDADIRASYDKTSADAILGYKNETRNLYDSLLERVNAERVKFGQEPIQGRKDYITHLQELNGNTSFTGDVVTGIKNSFTDEGMQKTRAGVPGEIAGRTENFQPTSAFNKFMQRRTGTKSLRDPFMAVQEYLEPALYNIHMTESTVRARTVEAAFRTAGELQRMSQGDAMKIANDALKPYMNNGDNGKLVAGFQEYANALGKKTQRWDRQVIDASDATAMGLKGWQKLQKIGGQSTILGNLSSVLAQPLNQVVAIADVGPKTYLKAIAKTIGGDKAIMQSDFIRARRTKAKAPIRSRYEKTLDAGAVPLEKVEMASIEHIWNTQHVKALEQGHTGKKAIQMADYNTERLVAGRGIADRPEVYRSTVANGFLQYTLEVNAQYKTIMKDLSPSQKATFLVAAMGVNTVMGAVTGQTPLPDFLGAAFETGQDFVDPEDDRSGAAKAVGGAKRFAGEFVGMNPVLSAGANTLLSQDQRKAIFGEESNVGMFEGTAAPIQVIRNTANAGINLAKGKYTQARNDAMKNLPFGNQAKKTLTGAEMLAAGYAVDSNGNPTYAAPTSNIGKAQGLMFGPNATKNAQNYYANNQSGLTENQAKTAKASSNPGKAVQEIQDKRLANRGSGGKIDKTYNDAVAGIKSSYGGKYSLMSEEELKAASTSDQQAKDVYNKIKAVKKSSETADDLPSNLDSKATKLYNQRARLTEEGKTKWNSRPADKEITSTLHSWLPPNVEKPPINNEIAGEWADYEKKKANGTLGKLEAESEKETLLKKAYNSQLNEDEKDLYKLSEANLLDAYDRGLINDGNIEKALKIEKQLFDAGLISKETLARKLGQSARGYKSGKGGKGRKGGKGGKKTAKFDYTKNLFDSGTSSASNTKALRAILEQAMKA